MLMQVCSVASGKPALCCHQLTRLTDQAAVCIVTESTLIDAEVFMYIRFNLVVVIEAAGTLPWRNKELC